MLKLNKDSVVGTFVIITGFCLVCSVLVSSAVVALSPFQEAAVATDRQVKILNVAGIDVASNKVAQTYQARIEAKLLNVDSGKFVSDSSLDADSFNFQSLAKDPAYNEQIPAEIDSAKIRVRTKLMPVFIAKDESGAVERYILPFYGQGLWSTMYGYIAVAPDGNTIKGITFYSHGETPGLGGEIDNPRWQAFWLDKKIFREDGSRGLHITKTPDHQGAGKDYDIDTISGATLTARGVDNAALYWLNVAYKPFFDNIRNGGDLNE